MYRETVKAQDTENAIDELIVYVDVKNAGHAEGGVYTREIGYEEFSEYVERVEMIDTAFDTVSKRNVQKDTCSHIPADDRSVVFQRLCHVKGRCQTAG